MIDNGVIVTFGVLVLAFLIFMVGVTIGRSYELSRVEISCLTEHEFTLRERDYDCDLREKKE